MDGLTEIDQILDKEYFLATDVLYDFSDEAIAWTRRQKDILKKDMPLVSSLIFHASTWWYLKPLQFSTYFSPFSSYVLCIIL